MALLSGVTVQMKVSVPCLVLGIVLFCVSFAVPSWWSGTTTIPDSDIDVDFRAGLWRFCSSYGNLDRCFAWTADDVKSWKKDWFLGPQMLQCCALISLLGVLGSFLAALITKRKVAVVASFICSFVSGTFMMLGSILFGISFKGDSLYPSIAHLTWGFAFNIIASIFTLAGGVGLVFYAIYARIPEHRPTELTPP